MLLVEVQHGATGHQQLETRCGGEQLCQQRSRRSHLLEVVEQQQLLFTVEIAFQRVQQRVASGIADTESPSDGCIHKRRICDWGKVDEADSIVKGIEQPRYARREASFTDTVGSGECDQPYIIPAE